MHVLVIDGASRAISSVALPDGLAGLKRLIGQDSVDFDSLASGDRFYFDESCFLRPQAGAGRFQLDVLAPVSGIGVVVGSDAAGTLAAPQLSAEALTARVKFL